MTIPEWTLVVVIVGVAVLPTVVCPMLHEIATTLKRIDARMERLETRAGRDPHDDLGD